MATYGRHGVLDGQAIVLRAVFVDEADNLVSSVALPEVYIYDSSVDADTVEAEVEAETYASALAGPLTPTLISVGFYELSYVVPSGSSAGTWHDVWVGDITTTAVSAVLTFTVINGAEVASQQLLENELIIIELDETIADTDDNALGSDLQLSFLTRLKPYYSSPELVRMEIGPWLDFIPDQTMALMIHWSSKEADFILQGTKSSAERVKFARAKFVVFDAALRSLYLPGAFSYQPTGVLGSTKRLGDLSITNGNGAAVARTSSGVDTDTLAFIKQQRNEWWRVVNAGAQIVPGQGLGPRLATKGKYDPDRRLDGRMWLDPDCNYYDQPGLNAKYRPSPGRRGKFYWRPVRSGDSGETY